MSRVLGNILCDQGQGQIMYFLVMHLLMGCSNIKLCWCIGHMMLRVLGKILCDLDPFDHDVEGKASCDLDLGSRSNQIFLVNAFPPTPLDIAASNFAGA